MKMRILMGLIALLVLALSGHAQGTGPAATGASLVEILGALRLDASKIAILIDKSDYGLQKWSKFI